jgi:hypothetical protein
MNARLLAIAFCVAAHLALGGCGKYGPPVREAPELPEAAEAEAPDAGSDPDARDDDEETIP